MAPDFYTISGQGKPQPGSARRNDGPPHPPPNGPPRGPPRGPPQGLPQGPPQGPPQGHSHGHLQAHPVVPPAPPRNLIPVDLRGGPASQISDVSQDLLSESDMREELTDYIVFRFEKMADKDNYDEHGRLKMPSWEKAIRTEDRSIPKQVAAEKIRQLNRSTKSVIDKKSSLTAALKRQIDATLEVLMSREPDLVNYQWVLAQIDHQLKPVAPYFSYGFNRQYVPARGHRSSTDRLSAKRRIHPGVNSRHHKKKTYEHEVYERLSLTAYFKRVPRLNVDILSLWDEKRRGLGGAYWEFPPSQPPLQTHHNQCQAQHGAREQGPPPQQMPQRVSSGAHPPHRGMSPKVHQHNGQRNPKKPQSRNKDARFSDSDSESGSGSASSRCSSSAGSPPTSVSDHRGRGHLKTHGHVRGPGNPPHPHGSRHERPREHGQNGGPRPQHVPVSPHRAPRAPGPPYPPIQEGSVASHIERIRDDAYLRGRLAERSDARLVEELAQSKMHAQRRPHINQEQSPRRLFMLRTDMDDVPRQFARLSVDDDGVDDVILRREDARRRREFEYRAQRGSILDEDPFEGPPSPSSYTTYSTDGRRRGLHIMEIPDRYSPSPRPRRVRAYY